MQNETEKSISRRRILFSWSMATLAFLLGLAISYQLGILDMERRQSDVRSQTTHDLSTIRARLEGVINTVFSATSGLTEVIAHQDGIPEELFEALARQAIKEHPQIRNIAAAPDNIITLIYPLKGNEQALGLRYATLPEQLESVQEAMQTRRPVFSGPHNLIQGGRGLIARVPIFSSHGRPSDAAPHYWGMVSVVIDIDALLDTGWVRSTDTLEIGLRKMDAYGSPGVLIGGNNEVFTGQTVNMKVILPGGEWQIAAVPKSGWKKITASASPLFYIGIVNSLFVAVFIRWLVARPYRARQRNQELRQEISDRVQVENQLRLSEQKYAAIFHMIPDSAGITRMKDGHFLEVNAGFTKITGWEAHELIDRTSVEIGLWTAEARAGGIAIMQEKGWLENYEYILNTKSGELRNALMFMIPIKVKGEDCIYFMSRDITELKQAQNVLENERIRLRNLLQTIPAPVWMKDAEARFLFCNSRFEQLIGARESDIIGKSDYDFFPFDLAEFFCTNDHKAIAAGQSTRNEEWLTFADDGHRELVETIVTPVYDVAGHLTGVLGVAWDITEKKRIEEELRTERTRFFNLVDSVDGVVWESDAKTFTFTYVSKQAQRLFGYPVEAWLEQGFWQLHLHPDDRKRVFASTAAFTAQGEDHDLEYRFLAQDGRTFWVQDIITVVTENGLPRWRRGIMVDTTKRKEAEKEKLNLEAQLRQAQKMEAVGRLAGGVAHDFNNKLSVILGYADLTKEENAPSDKTRGYLNQIIKAATQSRDITRQLLVFSRQEEIAPRVLNLNALVTSVQKGLGRFIREDIRFELRLSEGLWPINMDPSQIDQVIMNLLVNARDAMANGGQLLVETKNVCIDATFASEHPETLREGEYVQLTVSDTGCGMSEENLQHIFEPFYTTKEAGKGTGLGLATVYGIVTQNKGLVLAESALGTGSTFRVFFPRCYTEGQPEVAEVVAEPEQPQCSATILLVEDEETVRQMTTEMLELSGYTTLTATTPQEALDICARAGQRIDLLLTDVIMPGMNGRELSRHIEALRPDIKVLFMSGYAADILSKTESAATELHFIQKPFSLRTLLDNIKDLLQGDREQKA